MNCNKTRSDDNPFINPSSCLEGYHLPEFKSVANDGHSISMRGSIGKSTVINLWFIGCVPCELEIPGLDYLGSKYKDDVNFIAIGLNSKEDLDKYLSSEQKWDFIHINDPNSELLENVFKHEWGYPTTFIADRDGVIRKANRKVRAFPAKIIFQDFSVPGDSRYLGLKRPLDK